MKQYDTKTKGLPSIKWKYRRAWNVIIEQHTQQHDTKAKGPANHERERKMLRRGLDRHDHKSISALALA